MGTRKGTTVSMLKGRVTFLMKCEQPVSIKRLDELLGKPDPVAEAEAERAAELAAARERLRLANASATPVPRARDLKAWAKNEQRVAEQEEAAQQQKWADMIGKADSPDQG